VFCCRLYVRVGVGMKVPGIRVTGFSRFEDGCGLYSCGVLGGGLYPGVLERALIFWAILGLGRSWGRFSVMRVFQR